MSEKQDGLRPITPSQIAMMEEAVAGYESTRSLVEEWLAGRGIAPETAATFRLGGVAEPFPGHERLVGHLAIPYLGISQKTGAEEVWSIRFRCIPDLAHPGLTCKDLKHGKYHSLPGEQARMFNVRAIKEATDEIHLTEGELDAVILNQAMFPAVGMPGATQWRWHHAKELAGFNRIYVWGDPDEAGAKFTADVLRACRNAAPVRMPGGDVGEVFLRGGYELLDELKDGVKWE